LTAAFISASVCKPFREVCHEENEDDAIRDFVRGVEQKGGALARTQAS